MEVRWVSCGSPMGVQLSLEGVVVVQWESAGSPLEVYWESTRSLLGIFKMVCLEVLSK